MTRNEAVSSGDSGVNGVPDQIFAPTILVGALLILQPQSMMFWMDILGGESPDFVTNATAVVASLFLEVLALWRWFTPKKSGARWWEGVPLFAWLVTALLLAGPLYRVAYPLWSKNVEESQAAFQKSETVKVLNGEITNLNAQLEAYLRTAATCQSLQGQVTETRRRLAAERVAMSQAEAAGDKVSTEAGAARVQGYERDIRSLLRDMAPCGGVTGKMDAARQQLADRSEKYRQAVAMRETAELNLGRKVVIVLHSLMLIAAQFGSVLAIRALGRVYHARGATSAATPDAASSASMAATAPSRATTSAPLPLAPPASPGPAACSIAISTKVADIDDLPVETVELISKALAAHLEELKKQGVSARTWASLNGYDRREFPLLKKHRELLEAGERTASPKTIRRLGEYFKLLPAPDPASQESA